MTKIRIPTQKRSIEKRNRIIEKGFELMCNKGYYNTNTTQIAEYANVSTGIIYQYFNDKKEIFLEGVKNYSDKIMYPMNIIFESNINKDNLNDILSKMINDLVRTHTMEKKAHEELLAMSHLDNDVALTFKNKEIEMTKKIVNLLIKNNVKDNNLMEKVHIASNIVDNFCHEVVYHKHDCINYDVMKDEVINIIINMLFK